MEDAVRSVVGRTGSEETRRTTATGGTGPTTRMLDRVRKTAAGTLLKKTLSRFTLAQRFIGGAVAVCCLVAASFLFFGGDSDDRPGEPGIVDRQQDAASQLQLGEPVVQISPADGVELALVVIPSGEFVMGTTP